MKKFLYKLPIWATVFSVLLCSILSINIQPSFAASSVLPFEFYDGKLMDFDGNTVDYASGYAYSFILQNEVYEINFSSSGVSFPISLESFSLSAVTVVYIDSTGQDHTIYYNDSSPFTIDCTSFFSLEEYLEVPGYALVLVNSVGAPPVVYEVVETEPLYYSAFQMFADFIYGEGAELTAEQNMTLTILATLASLFVVLFPFLIVFLFVWLFFRLR